MHFVFFYIAKYTNTKLYSHKILRFVNFVDKNYPHSFIDFRERLPLAANRNPTADKAFNTANLFP